MRITLVPLIEQGQSIFSSKGQIVRQDTGEVLVSLLPYTTKQWREVIKQMGFKKIYRDKNDHFRVTI